MFIFMLPLHHLQQLNNHASRVISLSDLNRPIKSDGGRNMELQMMAEGVFLIKQTPIFFLECSRRSNFRSRFKSTLPTCLPHLT